jgi:hypothetical protein
MAITQHRGGIIAAGTAVAIAAGVAVSLLPLSWSPFVLILVLAVTAGQFWLLRRVSGLSFPFAAIPMMTFNLVGVTGFLYYGSLEGIARVADPLPNGARESDAAAVIFALASASITVGAVVASIRRRRSRASAASTSIDIRTGLSRLPTAGLLAGAAAVLILAVLALGPAEFLSRGYYLDRFGPQWMGTVSDVLAPLGLAAAAAILFGDRSPIARLTAAVLIAGYVADLLSRDTRTLALVPLIMFALYAAQRSWRPWRFVPAILAVACSLLLLQLCISLRSQVSGAGLIPYTTAVVQNPGPLLEGNLGGAIGNVLYSVPLTGYIAEDVGNEPPGSLAVSLDPLPGTIAGWTDLAPLLRVTFYTPYNALGELALQGTLVLILYFLVVGYLTTRLQSLATSLHGLRSAAMLLALGGLIAAFSVFSLQYNLRSTTRYVWYALGLYLVLRFVPVLVSGRRRTTPSSQQGSLRASS